MLVNIGLAAVLQLLLLRGYITIPSCRGVGSRPTAPARGISLYPVDVGQAAVLQLLLLREVYR